MPTAVRTEDSERIPSDIVSAISHARLPVVNLSVIVCIPRSQGSHPPPCHSPVFDLRVRLVSKGSSLPVLPRWGVFCVDAKLFVAAIAIVISLTAHDTVVVADMYEMFFLERLFDGNVSLDCPPPSGRAGEVILVSRVQLKHEVEGVSSFK